MKASIYELKLKVVPTSVRESQKLDVVATMTVIAETSEMARELASQQSGPEGSRVWLDPNKVSCKKLPLTCQVVERITINQM